MGLAPKIAFPTSVNDRVQPSKTYHLDIETGEITQMVDGLEAIQQFITKAVHTIRYHFPIYSHDYGCEIKNLLGRGFSERFIKSEIVRMITEALIYDDRIEKVYDFDITSEEDSVYVAFQVMTSEGTINYKGVI
ncbi:DUF2634 domain-containing protein [Brevibacillus dissolubilis]|uniref:DUF2634 domain-containing protein n=1 Tax=Brevibacillus dissolubilis TaxID=1844116 RepID=UPI00111788E1|nr:DUF2634 domain-containing protein [Brevibacillus dissolubilis]